MNQHQSDTSQSGTGELSPPVGIRYHYMDNLRALAMITGIFFHAALAYSPLLNNLWLTASNETSVTLDSLAWFTHLFRMPLFFLIAGFFTCYLVQKRGISGLLKNRLVRIFLPLFIFLPLVWITLAAGIGWALSHVGNPSPMLQFFAMMANVPDAPPPPVTTTHLWFLYNLCLFYVVYSLLSKLGLFEQRWMQWLSSAKFLVFGLPWLLVPAMFSQFSPHPAPEQFMPQWWSFAFFGLFFLVGSGLFRNQSLLDDLKPYALWLFIASVVMYGVFYSMIGEPVQLADLAALATGPEKTPAHLLMAGLESFIAVYMTLVCLIIGKSWLERKSHLVRFVADSSYWVYLIHLPLLFLIQYLLLDVQWNLWLEFAISSLGTLAIGIISYTLLVRWTPIGWMLNGRRSRPQPAVDETPDLIHT